MIYPIDDDIPVTTKVSPATYASIVELANVQNMPFDAMLSLVITRAVNPQELDPDSLAAE